MNLLAPKCFCSLNFVYSPRRLHDRARGLGVNVQGIGVGIAELVNLWGEITSDYLLGWRPLPARETLSQIAPTLIESDARAPELVESAFWRWPEFQELCLSYRWDRH